MSSPRTFDPKATLPLHADLYLLAHDTDSGALLVNQQSLELGLAGALLLELVFDRRVVVGQRHDAHRDQWHWHPGCLTLRDAGPTENTLWSAALTTAGWVVQAHRPGEHLRAWLHTFAASDLYERVRASLLAAGLVQRSERRKLGGLMKTEVHLPVHYGFAVRARGQIRAAVAHHAQDDTTRSTPPGDTCVALCGLFSALELGEFLYDPMPARDLDMWLKRVVEAHADPAITAVMHAVDAGRGDLALAAMR